MNRNIEMHLTVEEIKDFVLEELSEEAAAAIDSHLEICDECTEDLENFYTAQDQFPAAQWAAQRSDFVASLRQQIFGSPINRLQDFFKSFANAVGAYLMLPQQPAFAASSMGGDFDTKRDPVDLESGDKAFVLFIEEEEDGRVTLRFDSSELELEGTVVRFHKGNWEREARLEKVPGGRVGVEIIVSRDERAQLPQEGDFQAEPIGEKN